MIFRNVSKVLLCLACVVVAGVGCQLTIPPVPPLSEGCLSNDDCPIHYICSKRFCWSIRQTPAFDDDEVFGSLEQVVDGDGGGISDLYAGRVDVKRGEPIVRDGGPLHTDVFSGRSPELRPERVIESSRPEQRFLPDDDQDPDVRSSRTCVSGQTRSCYPKNTWGCSRKVTGSCIAPCRLGKQRCVGGAWSGCQGVVTPKNDTQCRATNSKPCDSPDGRCP